MQEFRLVVTVDDVILEHNICVITVVGKQCQYSTADLLKDHIRTFLVIIF